MTAGRWRACRPPRRRRRRLRDGGRQEGGNRGVKKKGVDGSALHPVASSPICRARSSKTRVRWWWVRSISRALHAMPRVPAGMDDQESADGLRARESGKGATSRRWVCRAAKTREPICNKLPDTHHTLPRGPLRFSLHDLPRTSLASAGTLRTFCLRVGGGGSRRCSRRRASRAPSSAGWRAFDPLAERDRSVPSAFPFSSLSRHDRRLLLGADVDPRALGRAGAAAAARSWRSCAHSAFRRCR